MKRKKHPVVFLDRDGTLLNERGYLSDPSKMAFYPNVIKSLKSLRKAGFKLVLVTNQSGIGRGFFTEKQFRTVHHRFTSLLKKKGARIDGLYYCPHHPQAGCACRKPKTTLARKAARHLNLDLQQSYMVGDQTRDMIFAHRLGGKGILVLTGSGHRCRLPALKWASKVSSNMSTATRWILNDFRK